jgi:transposase InsO family protein
LDDCLYFLQGSIPKLTRSSLHRLFQHHGIRRLPEIDGDKQEKEIQALRNLIKIVPYKIHTILTDNGIQFTKRKVDKQAWMHIFDGVCHERHIDHRLTKVNHPWTNGQVERMNRTLKEANCEALFMIPMSSSSELIFELLAFVNAYNFANRIKTLKGLTSYEFIIKTWQNQPKKFITDPSHHNVRLNI